MDRKLLFEQVDDKRTTHRFYDGGKGESTTNLGSHGSWNWRVKDGVLQIAKDTDIFWSAARDDFQEAYRSHILNLIVEGPKDAARH